MKRNTIVVACTLVILFAACRHEQEPPAPVQPKPAATTATEPPKDLANAKINQTLRPEQIFLEKALLGADKGADGTVQTAKETFTAGEPIRLTMWLKESPSKLQTHVDWKDAKDKVIETERRDMNGAKVATFELKKKLKPGTYKAVGYWGGNIACQPEFTVETKADH
jgi:hypothetical protein